MYDWQHPEPLAKPICLLDGSDRAAVAADLPLRITRPDSTAQEPGSGSHWPGPESVTQRMETWESSELFQHVVRWKKYIWPPLPDCTYTGLGASGSN